VQQETRRGPFREANGPGFRTYGSFRRERLNIIRSERDPSLVDNGCDHGHKPRRPGVRQPCPVPVILGSLSKLIAEYATESFAPANRPTITGVTCPYNELIRRRNPQSICAAFTGLWNGYRREVGLVRTDRDPGAMIVESSMRLPPTVVVSARGAATHDNSHPGIYAARRSS
jgi:hypothetical protein